MSTFYVVAWHENNNIIAVEAPTAVEACRRAGLDPRRCLASRQRGSLMVCPYMLDMEPADGVYTDAVLRAIRRHARRCEVCKRIVSAVMKSLAET